MAGDCRQAQRPVPAQGYHGRTMSDLPAAFETAVAHSKLLTERPDNATLLKLYALYKQARAGDAAGEAPGWSDPVGRAKWDAWHGLQGQDRDSAMRGYIALVDALK
jgi:acyl-CoA-binding protein